MNNTNQPPAEQVSKPPEHLHDTAGMILRKARESANLTHAAVGEALHLTVHYIKALENDDYSKLPGATFVKGYLRAYARFLKLDVNAVLASYEKNNVSVEALSNRTESLSRSQKRHDQTFRWAVVTAIIIVLGIVALWWFVGKDQVEPRVVTNSPQTTSQPQANRPVATTASGRVAGQNSFTQTANTTAQGFTPNVAATPGVTTNSSTEVAGAVNSSTGQGLPPFGNEPRITPAIVNAIGVPAVINANVPDLASLPATNPAAPNNSLPGGNALIVAETAQTPAVSSTAINNQATPVPTSDTTLSAIPDQEDVALTITPTATGASQVTLISAGADMLQLYFKGTSWVEIDDGAKGRLYNETLNGGDAMTLHGTAPFTVLLGDATQVELTFNSVPINLSAQIRNDKTARFSLGASVSAAENTPTSKGVNP
jgi:cytoskeleton protein RodZ